MRRIGKSRYQPHPMTHAPIQTSGVHSWRKSRSCKPSSTKSGNGYASLSEPSSRSVDPRPAEEPEPELETSTGRSSRTEHPSAPSSTVTLEPAKTLSQQPCFSATCPHRQIPKLDRYGRRSRVSSKSLPYSKPKAQPRDIKGQPQNSRSSPPATKGRPLSTRRQPHEPRRRPPVEDRIIDNRAARDTRYNIIENRRCKHGEAEDRGYSAHRGGHYDNDEDR